MPANGADAQPPGIHDPFQNFQEWFRQEIEKRDLLNRDLQAQLEQYKARNLELQAKLDSRDALEHVKTAPGSTDEPVDHLKDNSVSYATHAMLREQYEVTYKSLKVAHQAMEKYKAKYQKAKDSVRPWVDYAKRCETRLEARLATKGRPSPNEPLTPLQRPMDPITDLSSSRPSSNGADAIKKKVKHGFSRSTSSTPATDGKDGVPAPKSPRRLRSNVMAYSAVHDEKNQAAFGVQEHHHGPQRQDSLKNIPQPASRTPSLITQSFSGLSRGSDELPRLKEPRARSLPVETQSREPPFALRPDFVKPQEIPSEGSPRAPIRIKSEPDSSPHHISQWTVLPQTGSFDLDDLGSHIGTPRRQKLRRMQTLVRGTSSFHGDIRILETGRSLHAGSVPSGPLPLQPLSPNRNNLPRNNAHAPKSTTRKRKRQRAEEVVSVTEDGDDIHSRSRHMPSPKKSKADAALLGLLAEKTPEQRQIITPRTGISKSGQPQLRQTNAQTNSVEYPRIPEDVQASSFFPPKSAQPEVRKHQNDLVKTETPTIKRKAMIPPANKALPPQSVAAVQQPSRRSPRKRAVPLRQRPLAELRPEDFKLNPAAHGNLDLTKAEGFRTKEERKHLHSCADLNCTNCGKVLRDMARDLPITLGSALFASAHDDVDEQGKPLSEEERIIKYYEGDTFSAREVRSLPTHVWDERYLTAKTYLIAERYGRHKLKPMARAKSPPGFWDLEMMTTQDMDEQHQEVERRRQELVKDRYREANRRDGRWIFKDE